MLDELGLTAGPVWCHHHPPRDTRTNVFSHVTAHQVQTEIDSGSDTGAGGDVTVVDVQDSRIDRERRVAFLQFPGTAPVCGRRPTVEQTRSSKRKRPSADRHNPDPVLGSVSQQVEHSRRRRISNIKTTVEPRDDYGVRIQDLLRARYTPDTEAGGGRYLARRSSDDRGLVFIFIPEPEDLRRSRQIESYYLGKGQDHHLMGTRVLA